MPHLNLWKAFSSETILLMHQCWSPSFLCMSWGTPMPEQSESSFSQPSVLAVPTSQWPNASQPLSSLCATHKCRLSGQEGPQRWYCAKPSSHRGGNSSPETLSHKRVWVSKPGPPTVLCSCQQIQNLVLWLPRGSDAPQNHRAGGGLRAAAVYLFSMLRLNKRSHLKERVSL